VESIGAHAFRGCTGLTDVTIPDSVESIGNGVFAGCTGLTQVTIPDSVESIGIEAFRDCTSLTHIAIPNSVESIGIEAFRDCTSLTHIAIPNSVESIGAHAFRGCTGLTDVTIPDSVESIGNGVFAGCTGLTQVTIPDSVTSIGSTAFDNCSSLQVIAIEDEDVNEYQRIVRLLPPAQQQLTRPWSELKAAETIKQKALESVAALSMRGITAHLILKLSIKPEKNFPSVWAQLPQYLSMFQNSHAWPCRESLWSRPCINIDAPGFATMFHHINKKMAFHLNPAVAQIRLPRSPEEFGSLFTRVTETAIPYSRRVLLKPVQTDRAPENCSDKDTQDASPRPNGN
jgi:hypothetical protein